MMAFLFDYFRHRRDCRVKQAERASRINRLSSYQSEYTASDRQILSHPIEELVQDVHQWILLPIDIIRAYGKAALKAHEKTNCLTEIMIEAAERWTTDGSVNLKGPLAGIPISVKDSAIVGGFDTTCGYSRHVGNKVDTDGIMIRILKDAGAIPYVKTNIPITLLSFESTNDVWGRCTNPHNSKYSPGGSTGGEAALLAAGGGRIGIGSDVAGSVRVPAAFSGIYSLKCSIGRWPKTGVVTCLAGQEGIPAVWSPMARTLEDLVYFTKSMITMQLWKYDYSIHPIPWRVEMAQEIEQKKTFKVGVLRTDGVVDPSPACARALEEVVSALRQAGHDVVDVNPPSPYEALVLASQLLTCDGCQTFKDHYRTGEWQDPGAQQLSFMMALPRPIKWLYYAWVKYIRRDDIWAGLIADWNPKKCYEHWKTVAKKEAFQARFHAWWQEEVQVDFLLTPVNATPAVPHDGMKHAVSSCGYTFLFNLLDYSCGVIPVTHVDKARDRLPAGFSIKKLNGVAQGAYRQYNATAMHGLPVAVQIVGQRLEEEKVLAIMGRVEEALGSHKYELLQID